MKQLRCKQLRCGRMQRIRDRCDLAVSERLQERRGTGLVRELGLERGAEGGTSRGGFSAAFSAASPAMALRAAAHSRGFPVPSPGKEGRTARTACQVPEGLAEDSGPVFLTDRKARVELPPCDIDQASGRARLSYPAGRGPVQGRVRQCDAAPAAPLGADP